MGSVYRILQIYTLIKMSGRKSNRFGWVNRHITPFSAQLPSNLHGGCGSFIMENAELMHTPWIIEFSDFQPVAHDPQRGCISAILHIRYLQHNS